MKLLPSPLSASRPAAVLVAFLAASASAFFPKLTGMQVGPIEDDTVLEGVDGTNGWGTFDQLLDHSNPSLGTFSQRFWYGTQYWQGPGSPIILVNPGEQSATGFNKTYTNAQRLTGKFAQAVGGAVVIVEHRYWGESSPFDVQTVENLQYLTLDNSLKDMTYFARNFVPPFDPSGNSTWDKAPWIYTGGSYPGALAGWLASVDPDTFWAYYGTSGVVEAIGDFWQYFAPVQEATPQNCSSDLSALIDFMDNILVNGTAAQKQKLKAKFMLEDLEDADFMGALEYGPWQWQNTQFYSVPLTGVNQYYQFCDYVENAWPNATAPVPGPEGVGVCKALAGYAKWWTEVYFPGFCEGFGYPDFQGTYNTGCFAYLNASNPMYKDMSVGNPSDRQWIWMTCNEPFGWFQDGAPTDRPSIVSRLVNYDYAVDTCGLWFPESQGGFGIARGKTAADVNAYTGGWSVTNTTRLMYANGELDPWRFATVSSDFRPGGPLQSTPELPVHVVPGGIHCSDLYGQNWAVNPAVAQIADEETAIIVQWVDEFYQAKGVNRTT